MTKDVKTETTATEKAAEDAFDLAASAAFYRENSTVQKNGVRVIKADDFHNRLAEQHGVTTAELEKIQKALTDERSAVTLLAGEDLEEKIVKAKADGKTAEELKALTSTVRLPMLGQEEDLTVLASETKKVAKKAGSDGPTEETHYGVVVSSVTRHMALRKPVVESLASRMARAMGVDKA